MKYFSDEPTARLCRLSKAISSVLLQHRLAAIFAGAAVKSLNQTDAYKSVWMLRLTRNASGLDIAMSDWIGWAFYGLDSQLPGTLATAAALQFAADYLDLVSLRN